MKIIRTTKTVTASKRVQDWVKHQEEIQADSAMGQDDGFFTPDDCIEFIEVPLEKRIREEKSYGFQNSDPINLRAHIDENNNLEVDCDVDDCFFTLKAKIDMRKIKKPSDIKKYVTDLFWQFDKEYSKCIEGCDKITASDIINTSNGDYEITPHGDGFTVQLEGDEVYFDTREEALAAIMEDAGSAVNAATEPNPEDWKFNPVPLRSLKKGEWFTVKPIAYPTDKQVYIKDDYDREEKKFMCGKCDDISYSTYFKGDKLVYTDFIY